MNYTELIDRIAIASEVPRPLCERVYTALYKEAAKGIQRDGEVRMTNFATIYQKEYAEKEVFDVNILAMRKCPPKIKLKYLPAKKFKNVALGLDEYEEEEQYD